MNCRVIWLTGLCVAGMLTASVRAEGNLLVNGDFAKADAGKPAAWQVRGKQAVAADAKIAPAGASQSLRVDISNDGGDKFGEVVQEVAVKANTRYKLSGQVKATARGMALLQVKRLRDGKEIERIATPWNKNDWTPVALFFDSGEADRVQVICRYRQRAEDVGRSAWFAALSLTEAGESMYDGPEAGPTAVPTFHSVGLYWQPNGGGPTRACTVRYRLKGAADWKAAMPLWFDPYQHDDLPERSLEYRGSIVNLQPASQYEVELTLDKSGLTRTLSFSTWSEEFKIARRVAMPLAQPGETFVIREGGNAKDGYVLYAPPAGKQAVWDAAGKLRSHIRVEAPYVIVRGMTLKNAEVHGIELGDVQDVVIDSCDISGWGRVKENDGFGVNLDSALYAASKKLERIVVERCRLHHPRSDSNSWKEERRDPGKTTFHPGGAQGICFRGGKGRYVIRYNRIDSDLEHMFNDSMGEVHNFSHDGFPNRDSDVYGNYISHCWDDGIEIEGANMNVRVWENYITMTFIGIGAASTSLGPSYYFRNVYAVSRGSGGTDAASFRGHGLIKLGSEPKSAAFSRGRKYFLHNTILQPPSIGGPDPTSGAQAGLALTSPTKRELNIVSRNNILHLRKESDTAIRDPQRSPTNDFDYDLYIGQVQAVAGAEAHGIRGVPKYDRAADGRLWLRPGTPGHDAAQRLPNFNDDFTGKQPDVGAVETGTTRPKPETWPAFP